MKHVVSALARRNMVRAGFGVATVGVASRQFASSGVCFPPPNTADEEKRLTLSDSMSVSKLYADLRTHKFHGESDKYTTSTIWKCWELAQRDGVSSANFEEFIKLLSNSTQVIIKSYSEEPNNAEFKSIERRSFIEDFLRETKVSHTVMHNPYQAILFSQMERKLDKNEVSGFYYLTLKTGELC